MKRYHVIAMGSKKHPDIDAFLDEIPVGLYQKYTYIDIQKLEPISLAIARAHLENAFEEYERTIAYGASKQE